MVISVALVFVGIQTPVAHAAQRQISIEKLGLLGRVQFAAKSIKKDSQLKPPITEATTGPVSPTPGTGTSLFPTLSGPSVGFTGPSTSSTGTSGLSGTSGALGAFGLTGMTINQGSAGLRGPQGSQGPEGLQGATGAQGTAGTQGLQGIEGPQGVCQVFRANKAL